MAWDVDSLKEHLDKRFDDADKAVQAALAAQEKAILKAEAAAEERFKLLNELRQGVATKEQIEALEKVVNILADRLTRIEGSAAGSQLTKGAMYTAVGAVGVVLGIIVLLANNVFK